MSSLDTLDTRERIVHPCQTRRRMMHLLSDFKNIYIYDYY